MQVLTQLVGIKREAVNQVRHPDDFTALARKQFETNEISKSACEGQDFGRQSSF